MEKKTLAELDDNDLGCYIEVWSPQKDTDELRCSINGILINYEHTEKLFINAHYPVTKLVVSGHVDAYAPLSRRIVQVFNRDTDGNLS